MKNMFRAIAGGYLIVFLLVPFILSDMVKTDLQGYIITYALFAIFGIGGTIWILDYGRKKARESEMEK